MSNKNQTIEDRVIVIRGRIQSPPLLGRESLSRLGMLKICPEGSLLTSTAKRVENSDVSKIIDEYSQVF